MLASQTATGASSDIQQATAMARNMVIKWGLSDKVGTVYHGPDRHQQSFGRKENEEANETSKLIDDEIKLMINNALKRAQDILTKKKEDLEKLAQALLEYETLSGVEIKDILAGKKIKRGVNAGKKTLKNFIPKV